VLASSGERKRAGPVQLISSKKVLERTAKESKSLEKKAVKQIE